MTELHAWFHCYADGEAWQESTSDYLDALTRFGLYDQLASLKIGFMGQPQNIELAEAWIRDRVTFDVVAREPDKWEQATLIPLHEWCQTHDGHVLYCHSKGAGYVKPVSRPWRRAMLYETVVRWQRCVELLDAGKRAVGCHYIRAEPSITDPAWGWSGMFGGNFWWTRAEILRSNVPPTLRSRLDAEHWLFQLTEVMDMSDPFVADLCPGQIGVYAPEQTEWG